MPLTKFSRVYIEITNRCNLACSFCAGNTRPVADMPPAQFAYVVQQVAAYTRHIYLHVLGEPLLHPQLPEILAIAHHHGMSVNLTTNGTVLAQNTATLLAAPSLRKVSISLHCQEAGHSGAYLQQVAAFVTAGAAQSILCDLRLWNLAETTDNQLVFTQLCRLLGVDALTQQAAKAKIAQQGNSTLAPNIFLGTAPRFSWPSLSAPLTNQPVFCHGLRSQMALLVDGTVVPCCLDSRGDIALGNIFAQPLGDILQSPRATALYQGFSARRPTEELCRRCGYATAF